MTAGVRQLMNVFVVLAMLTSTALGNVSAFLTGLTEKAPVLSTQMSGTVPATEELAHLAATYAMVLSIRIVQGLQPMSFAITQLAHMAI
jgi:hypothetical protein